MAKLKKEPNCFPGFSDAQAERRPQETIVLQSKKAAADIAAGNLHAERGNPAAAIAAFQAALAANPMIPEAGGILTNLARCYAHIGRANDANPKLLMCFGQMFIQLEQREMGIAAYDLYAERRPLAPVNNTEHRPPPGG